MLVSVLEEEWFAQLVSDSPGGGGGHARRLVFREEAVTALATACAQVRLNETERDTERDSFGFQEQTDDGSKTRKR